MQEEGKPFFFAPQEVFIKNRKRCRIITVFLFFLNIAVIVTKLKVSEDIGVYFSSNVFEFFISFLGVIGVWHGVFCKYNEEVDVVFTQIFFLFSFLFAVLDFIFVICFTFFMMKGYLLKGLCSNLFGCGDHGLDKAMAILIPIFLTADVVYLLFALFVLRLTYKYILALETFNGSEISRTCLSPLVVMIGSRLPIWRKYFLCCRKMHQRKDHDDKPFFNCDWEIRMFCSRGTCVLCCLVGFIIWIVVSIITCVVLTVHGETKSGFLCVYCSLFDFILAVFRSLGP